MMVIENRTPNDMNSRIRTSFSKWNKASKKTKLMTLGLTVLAAVAVPVTMYQLSHVQNLSQEASGSTVNIRVSDSTITSVAKRIWGINVNIGQKYQTADTFLAKFNSQNKFVELNSKIMRFQGGCPSQQYYWGGAPGRTAYFNVFKNKTGVLYKENTMNIDEGMKLTKASSDGFMYEASIYANGPQDEPDGCNNSPQEKFTSDDVMQVLTAYPGKIFVVELGNEPWFNWNPQVYADRVIEYAAKIKRQYPSIKIAISGYPHTDDPVKNSNWINTLKAIADRQCTVSTRETVDCFDYITSHHYALSGFDPSVEDAYNKPGLGAYLPIAQFSSMHRNFKQNYPNKPLAITEWNMRCFGDDADGTSKLNPALNTVEHSMYVGETFMQMAKNRVGMSNFFGLVSPSMGKCKVVDEEGNMSIVGTAFQLTSVAAGGKILATDVLNSPTETFTTDPECDSYQLIKCLQSGIYPKISAYSVYSPDNTKLYTFVFNRATTGQQMALTYDLTRASNIDFSHVTVETWRGNAFTDTSFISETNTADLSGASKIVQLPGISITRITIPVNAQVPTDTPTPDPCTKLGDCINPTPTHTVTLAPTRTPTPTKVIPTATHVPTRTPTVTPTVVSGMYLISGRVFYDSNNNGRYDMYIDSHLQNVVVVANKSTNNVGAVVSYTGVTTSEGVYTIAPKIVGTYSLRAQPPTGYYAASVPTVTLPERPTVVTVNIPLKKGSPNN